MEFRPIAAGDEPALQRFFAAHPRGRPHVPQGGRRRPGRRGRLGAARRRRARSPSRRARSSGRWRSCRCTAGRATSARSAWSSIPGSRGRGLGRALARHAVHDAVDLGLAKLVVEVIADQTALIGMFVALGFDAEALLADHVRDRNGQIRDLLVLANDVESQFAAMATAGITEEL